MPATSSVMTKPMDIPRSSSPVTTGGESPREISTPIDVSSDVITVGVLLAGTISDSLTTKHGSYEDMYSDLLKEKGEKYSLFKLKPYKIRLGHFPTSPHVCDAWLVSGSVSCANDPDLWIRRLECFIRQVYSLSIPMVGVCFGHQIMAKSLGGRVEKHPIGYTAGVRDYIFDGVLTPLVASHGDQVVEKPKDAIVVGYADYCRYAALRYPNNAFSIQPHPEFSKDFMQGLLLKLDLDIEPEERAAQLKSRSIAKYIRKFLFESV